MALLLSFCYHFSLTLINQLLPRLLSALVCLRLLSFTYHCRKYYFCRDKLIFVATKVCLSRQNICRDKHVCRCKHTFVATKMIVVAAASSDTDPVCPMSEQELNSVILKSKPTTCSVDLIPASLLFDCCDQPILPQIVNDNLLSGSFPSVFRQAVLKQLVEKAFLTAITLGTTVQSQTVHSCPKSSKKRKRSAAAPCLLEFPRPALPFPACLPPMSQH